MYTGESGVVWQNVIAEGSLMGTPPVVMMVLVMMARMGSFMAFLEED